ncbi:U3 small nucleolar RNA-associated protein 14 homolog A [Scaptodrosophila lebanonensis]|uniref:U3 small nucleolar RNA-associated protein 14 homolog A n=1 Tax=Drosophila lebanonensis TaxID=7225 RepID=A0A6J2TBL6_DROLE|nr:U3 small nucleolar RNA-associated protein 14 homolog A [Scaptodrosophila lebanonensis]
MSDDEEQYNPRSHRKLLQAISNLGSVQHIRKSTRDELQPQQDEFALLKSIKVPAASDGGDYTPKAVGLNDLVQILRTSKHVETGKKLKNVQSTKKVLAKPLEKPVADRIKRSIGYEGVKKKLARWDAVVAKQRSAETQIFPLPSDTIYINTSGNARVPKRCIKSDLAKELEASDMKLRTLRREQIGDTVDEDVYAQREKEQLEKKLTRKELNARRKELAYLKMRESQKSAKARMQNKIKSKKYHKLLKRQKMLEQVKEFELLQKTNPEAALEKLNELEKSRVLERASLRHKNTGTWAKNLQVRAKYDKDVRKDLAEQLAVSRQLTGKREEVESDEEQQEGKPSAHSNENDYDPFNPWTKVNATVQADTPNNDTDEPSWRKYWSTRNKNEKLLAEHRGEIEALMKENPEKQEEKPVKQKNPKNRVEEVESNEEQQEGKPSAHSNDNEDYDPFNPWKKANARVQADTPNNDTDEPSLRKYWSTRNKNEKLPAEHRVEVEALMKKNPEKQEEKPVKEKNKKKRVEIKNKSDARSSASKQNVAKKKDPKKPSTVIKNGWVVEKVVEESELGNGVDKSKTIEDIFDEQEDKQRERLTKKLQKITGRVKQLKTKKVKVKKPRKQKDELKNLNDLMFKNTRERPVIDEELNYEDKSEEQTTVPTLANVEAFEKTEEVPKTTTTPAVDSIDPNQVATITFNQISRPSNVMNDALGDEEADFEDDLDMDAERQLTISQAFEDDDIVADFNKDKTNDAEVKDTEIQLSMPGWGSWAGPGISQDATKKRNKRLILKLAEPEKRRDENKNNVYINENTNKHTRDHKVSNIPFPFKSLADYEASIRAPIGRNFVPETAFRMLTRPAVITRKGAIIEPMNETELVKPDRRLRHVVDRRIKRMEDGKKVKKM